MNTYIRYSVNGTLLGRPVTSGNLREQLGLKAPAKLPAAGMPARYIQGWVVKVLPLEGPTPVNANGRPYRRMDHRAIATCPHCHKNVSAGRTYQHAMGCKGTFSTALNAA